MSIDATSFLQDQIRKAKRRMEIALSKGETMEAALQARRVAELLRELAKRRPWGRKTLLELAEEYEELARKLSSGERIPPRGPEKPPRRAPKGPGRPGGGGAAGGGELGELDEEFVRQAEQLIARADVSWDEIVGLEEAKKALIEAIYYSMARPSVPGVRVEPPRRILLYGPPGTGKTMLAMAASNMLGATFMYVSVDRVLSRYVGDSPRMISAIFRVAMARAPSIVFFDEMETLAVKRDSGREAATGLVQTLLTELDGFKTKRLERPVIVIAATNKPWLLDEAILSRFEKQIYTPLPGREARMELFRLELERKGFQIEGITYEELADMTEGYSGRDIRNIARQAVIYMLRRANPDIYERLSRITSPDQLARETYRVLPITREELVRAIESVKPAVTPEDLRRYEEWRKSHE